MRLVAFFTVGGGLLGEVRFMTLGAVRNFAVSIMAEAAGKGGMFALVVAQLNDLAGMAGHAWVGYIVAECDFERCVGIRMATRTRSQFEMRFPFVALAAERNNLLSRRRVPIVTVLAADLGFVFAAFRCNVCRWFAVTFGAVIIRQFRGCRSRYRIGGINQALNQKKGQSGQ